MSIIGNTQYKENRVFMIRRKNVTGEIKGNFIFQKVVQVDAPSILAASSNSVETRRSAIRKNSVLYPSFAQIAVRVITTNAQPELAVQCT
jgi:hypothetical protein